nr:pre-rRNA-processing protein ESF2 [Ipomoea batatas]GMC62069.1 pre-rRNA-processing protein ESF2 [Ipomoea batatas]
MITHICRWVEFTKKSIAKRVAKMLNGQQIGGRKRSSFYYDIWNIKYLSKFKWDDLTEEIAYNNAVREQKLALEVSVAKKERDFFLTQVDKSRALSAIEERLKKKQKVQQESVETSSSVDNQLIPKLIRQVPQKKVVAAGTGESKTKLSKDTLAAVFGGSS